MTQPLEGLKVLDFTRVLAGPFATMILGDLGAEVIKAEPPNGDEARTWPPILEKGESGYFLSLNRNKKSITLNLKDPRAKDIVYIHKTQSGKGQYVDIALYDSMVSLLTIMAMQFFATRKDPGRWGLDHIHRVPAKAFETKDGHYVQVAATNEVMYPKFCELLGLEELINDPRFNTNAKRVENREAVMPLFEEKMRQKTRDEWLQVFEAAKLPCGPILNLSEVFADENILERDMMFTQEHPIEGVIQQLGFPFKFSQTPAEAKLRPPQLGEHNEEVLGALGYSSQEIESFKAEKVI